MHRFSELIDRCTAFTLIALQEAEARTLDALQTRSESSLVKTLMMAQLQIMVWAVGVVSMHAFLSPLNIHEWLFSGLEHAADHAVLKRFQARGSDLEELDEQDRE